MGFKLKSPYNIQNVPIHEVPFSYDNNKAESDGLVAKANDNFSIIVNKNKVNDAPLMAQAMSHESEHLRQMFGIGKYDPGDLKYGPAGVEYKGKFFDRNSPSFNEADRTLPYEAPAYKAGESLKSTDDLKPENMKDQPSFNKIGTKGQDNESVSMNENFGVAMSKTWKSIPFTNDHGELTEPEPLVDKKGKEYSQEQVDAMSDRKRIRKGLQGGVEVEPEDYDPREFKYDFDIKGNIKKDPFLDTPKVKKRIGGIIGGNPEDGGASGGMGFGDVNPDLPKVDIGDISLPKVNLGNVKIFDRKPKAHYLKNNRFMRSKQTTKRHKRNPLGRS